jgi:hypothetical protein
MSWNAGKTCRGAGEPTKQAKDLLRCARITRIGVNSKAAPTSGSVRPFLHSTDRITGSG